MPGHLAALSALHNRYDHAIPPEELARVEAMGRPSKDDLIAGFRDTLASLRVEAGKRQQVFDGRMQAWQVGAADMGPVLAAMQHMSATLHEIASVERRLADLTQESGS